MSDTKKSDASTPGKIGHFDICKAMAQRGLDIRLAPLENVTLLRKVKAGTEVTIGVAGDLVGAIYTGHYVGGLLLCNAEQYRAIQKELQNYPITGIDENANPLRDLPARADDERNRAASGESEG